VEARNWRPVATTRSRFSGMIDEITPSSRESVRQLEEVMINRLRLPALGIALFVVGAAAAQEFPVLDMVANKVVQKYQSSNCEELWQRKGKPKSPEEQQVIQLLRGDPQMRAAFIDKVAAPIANKMFECGMLP
jgi:hypothetical protein